VVGATQPVVSRAQQTPETRSQLWDLTARTAICGGNLYLRMVMPIQIYAFAMQFEWRSTLFSNGALPPLAPKLLKKHR
jgi:hypothetical protein